MADEDVDLQSKTEPATPRKREEAAEQGRFAVSTELTTGITILMGVGGLAMLADTLGNALLDQTRLDLSAPETQDLTQARVQYFMNNLLGRGLAISGTLMGLLFVGTIVSNVGQVGLRINTERLTLDWDKVSPLHFDRLLSWSKSMRGLMLLLKIAAVAAVAWWILRQRGNELAHTGDATLALAVARSWSLVMRLAVGLAGTLFVIGVLDYAWQFWQFERTLRMSKQEIKEEVKREEGDPLMKGRIRKMQRENAQRKMFRQIPKASVVITNPTHLAVALQYESGKMPAPKVIAKGAGHIAKRIVRLARRYGVPVVERKPLAQALYKSVKVDREIPLGLYFVVAELLAYVYKLKGNAPASAATTRQALSEKG
jgi:flagellar biosynthetic protein FlhB